jgi:hypothetical protein
MLEFCRRGTLSAAQLVLGIDKNLPYVARQVSWHRRYPCLGASLGHSVGLVRV